MKARYIVLCVMSLTYTRGLIDSRIVQDFTDWYSTVIYVLTDIASRDPHCSNARLIYAFIVCIMPLRAIFGAAFLSEEREGACDIEHQLR